MQRYIDVDWIIQKLERWRDQLAETYGKNDEYVLCLGEVLMKLDDAPTADVVEVVRCRDCKWWRPFNDRMGHCGRGEMRHKDFYCQRGERADT